MKTPFKSIPRALFALALSAAAAGASAGNFPTVLTLNTTGQSSSFFLGVPDDQYRGLGSTGSVIYDFGPEVIVNRVAAVDLNVYEVDFGGPEFNLMKISASQDGISFASLKGSEVGLVRIAGDNIWHTNSSFGRSYDLGALAWARYVRIDGTGGGTPGGSNGFDLDAIGAHQLMPTPVPEPGTWALMLAGLGGIGSLARRRLV